MQWSECIPNASSPTVSSNDTNNIIHNNNNSNSSSTSSSNNLIHPAENGVPVIAALQPQQQQHQQQHRPQPPPPPPLQQPQLQQQQQQQQQLMDGAISPTCAAPTIKNHSVTHFGRYLYCFGGYDGRRNHTTLLVYDLVGNRWIRPIHYHSNIPNGTTGSSSHDGRNSTLNASTFGNSVSNQNLMDSDIDGANVRMMPDMMAIHDYDHHSNLPMGGRNHDHYHPNLTLNMDHSDTIIIVGTPPPGRNGHSATLAVDDDTDGENGRIVIIGGWLGTGPLAASDTHILDVSCHGKLLRWYQPTIYGTPPGPCNMHSADYVRHSKEVYVFRGGNGREYLNDLHALHVPTLTWRKVITTGETPQQRANHSSAILEETNELFIFGGWNGTERLNDIHILNTKTSTWTYPKIHGILPHPRAGMTLTALRGRLYLFGGSGQLAKCFYDLQIFDRASMTWLDVSQMDHDGSNDESNSISGGNNNNFSSNNVGISNSNANALVPNRHHHYQQQFSYPHHDPQFIYGGNQQFRTNNRSLHDGTHTTSIFGYPDDTPFEPQQAGGTQEGGSNSIVHINNTINVQAQNDRNTIMALPDWRSRESHHHHRMFTQQHPQHHHISPNPNDEDAVPSVLVHGHGPARRAGHTATAVGRNIYIFGGSYGSKYLNDFYILDTDPPPQAIITESNSLQLIERRLRHFFNDDEFADVTFIVQGQKVYGHKMILSIVSECFRAMFTTGFRESDQHEIEIPDCTYSAFVAVMEYIYTGTLPSSILDVSLTNSSMTHHIPTGDMHQRQLRNQISTQLVRVVEVLELADRFFLDHLKQICESKLQHAVTMETVEYLLPVAQKTNSSQLQSMCEHLMRNK